MASNREDIVDQAIAWHLHLEEASGEEWYDFTAWLEADPAHAAAYDSIALDDALFSEAPHIGDLLPAPANDDRPSVLRRLFAPVAGGAIAAALCAALLLPSMRAGGGSLYDIATPAGGTRTVTLEDGTRIALNGDTRLTLDRADPRRVTLDHGEAVFQVHHDPAHPFMLRSGDATIADIGTVFNVARMGKRLDIGVAEGAVMFQPDHEAVRLAPGMQLQSREDQGRVTIRHLDKASIGSWRTGRLVFRDDTLADVAIAIQRATSTRIEVAPDLAGLPFTGVVHLAGGADTIIPQVARLSGASWSHVGASWSLFAGTDRTR